MAGTSCLRLQRLLAATSLLLVSGVLNCRVAMAADMIVGMQSGLCLQPEGGVVQAGSRILLAECDGSPAQIWREILYSINGPTILAQAGPNLPPGPALVMDVRTTNGPGEEIVLAPFAGWTGTSVRSSQHRVPARQRVQDGLTFTQWGGIPNFLCLTATGGAGSIIVQGNCGTGTNQLFATVDNARPAPPQENVLCSVFDDGMSNATDPDGAIFIDGGAVGQAGKACVPSGPACRKWFGSCYTTRTFKQVSFSVFDDGLARRAGPSGAIYIPSGGGSACVPDATAQGTCRRWFGEGTVPDGRVVECQTFDDGGANPSPFSRAIYIPSPIPRWGAACIPDGTRAGTCRRWFGQCRAVAVATPPPQQPPQPPGGPCGHCGTAGGEGIAALGALALFRRRRKTALPPAPGRAVLRP